MRNVGLSPNLVGIFVPIESASEDENSKQERIFKPKSQQTDASKRTTAERLGRAAPLSESIEGVAIRHQSVIKCNRAQLMSSAKQAGVEHSAADDDAAAAPALIVACASV